MVQLNLNFTKHVWGMYSTWHDFHFSHIYTCMCMQDWRPTAVGALVQSICACTRYVHDHLQEHACMSVMYTLKMVHMPIDMYMNYKPRITV